MARTWLQIQVELEGGRGIECVPPPGRILIVGPSHTFTQLAEAIDVAFARWDFSHLHVFELADGREIGFADVDPGEHEWLDHDLLKVVRELKPGDRFRYTFDLGDDWRHRCEVLPEKVVPGMSGSKNVDKELVTQPPIYQPDKPSPTCSMNWTGVDPFYGDARRLV